MKVILAVMYTTSAVVKTRPEKKKIAGLTLQETLLHLFVGKETFCK